MVLMSAAAPWPVPSISLAREVGSTARRVLLLLFLLANSMMAQAVLSLASASGSPGSTLALDLTFATGQSVVAGLQWTFTYSPADIAALHVAVGPASVSSGQTLNCLGQAGTVQCVLISFKGTPVPSGVLAIATVEISRATRDGAAGIGLTDVLGVASNGSALQIQTHGSVLPISGAALRFRAVTPCRVADTRNGNPSGATSFTANSHQDFVIPESACGIPSTAVAYSLNVSVSPFGKLGYLTVWPTGQPQPLVATLNSLDGRDKSNAAIIAAGANGAISAYATDPTDVAIDVNGYFVHASDTAALPFYPLSPCRLVDTRNPASLLGGPGLRADTSRIFPVRQSACGVPADAQEYSLNVAVMPKGLLGHLTVWPAGQAQPPVASMGAPTGAITANAVIVAAGSNGAVEAVATDDTDLVMDINGYFAPARAGGLSLYNLAPCRVLDTRLPAGAAPFKGARDVNVAASGCPVPASAGAYVLNATVVPPGPLGFLTLWPQGAAQPVVATLNAVDGAITSNIAIVPTRNGSVSAFASDPTHLVLDIFGFFAP